MTRNIAKRWRELSGQNHWKKLLDPLDLDLRRYIIHYGQMAQATYDTFNSEEKSKYAGDSRYSKKNLFSKVRLSIANPFKYDPVSYFYGTSSIPVPACFILKSESRESWCKESNFMGYIAVTTDEGKAVLGRRDIVIAWRGTVQNLEWFDNFEAPLVSASDILGSAMEPKVHKGWHSIYTSEDPRSPYNKTSAREQVLTSVKELMQKYKDEETSITITGHSLGASLATINAGDIVANGYNKNPAKRSKTCPVTAIVFASPRVGDENFRDALQCMEDFRLLRIRNSPDIVPRVPIGVYKDVGEELLVNTLKSNYLKTPGSLKSWHSLEAYLHGVAGSQGSDGDFDLVIKRDVALVNKYLDALKDEYLVPSSWRCVENKGMVQQANGCWKLDEQEEGEPACNPNVTQQK